MSPVDQSQRWARGARVAGVLAASVLALGAALGAAHRLKLSVRRPAAAEATPDMRVVATFEGGQVTAAELQAAVANKAPSVRARYRQPREREALLHSMVDYALLIREAERRGYADSSAVRDALMLELANRVRRQVAGSVDPRVLDAGDLRAYYEAHRNRFEVPALRRASLVRVATHGQAEALAARARSMPVDAFRTLAVKLDRSGRGSELGYVDAQARPDGNPAAAKLDPVLVARAFELERVGQVAEPFEHDGAFMVLRLTARRDAIGATFESVVSKTREALAAERRQQALDALLRKLRTEQLHELHPELSDGITLDAVPGPNIPSGVPAAPPDPRAPTVLVGSDDL